MSKTYSLKQITTISKKIKQKNKNVGLIVGSFDVLHLGHLNLFRLAKAKVDFVIVGLDHDETIKITKGKNRPINNWQKRADFLNDLVTIDAILLIQNISKHGTEKSEKTYIELLDKIKPTHVFTHRNCDRHWEAKKQSALTKSIEFILDESLKITSSGEIIKKLNV